MLGLGWVELIFLVVIVAVVAGVVLLLLTGVVQMLRDRRR
jgi:hypothetical protein